MAGFAIIRPEPPVGQVMALLTASHRAYVAQRSGPAAHRVGVDLPASYPSL